MTQDRIAQLERTGDPEIVVGYHRLKQFCSTLGKPALLSQSDFEYFITLERLRDLEETGDAWIAFNQDGYLYGQLLRSWEMLADHNPTISEEQWEAAYEAYNQWLKDASGDPGIIVE